jgi:hypothetical protein
MAGELYFRPYSLYGEPKFLGAVTVVCFSFLMVANKLKFTSNKNVIITISTTLLIIALSASTSAMLGFLLVSITLALSGNMPTRTAIIVVLGVCLGLLATVLFFDLNALIDNRINERLTSEDGTLEGHEQYYLEAWTSDIFSFIFGRGYAYFGSTATESGFRLIPNSPIIWMGVSGGVIAISLFFLTICSTRDIRYTLPIIFSLLAYNTNSSFFLALIFSYSIRRYLENRS